jgi:hypothetical protein
MFDRCVDPLVQRCFIRRHRWLGPCPAALAARRRMSRSPAQHSPIKAWLMTPGGRPAGRWCSFTAGAATAGGWGRCGALVARGMTALLVDLPGHGRTGPVGELQRVLMVDDLRAVRTGSRRGRSCRGLPVCAPGFSRSVGWVVRRRARAMRDGGAGRPRGAARGPWRRRASTSMARDFPGGGSTGW